MVFSGVVARCLTREALALQSRRVLMGVHDGPQTDNTMRKQKDLARLQVLGIDPLFSSKQERMGSLIVVEQEVNGKLDTMNAKIERLVDMVRTKWTQREQSFRRLMDVREEAYEQRGAQIKRLEAKLSNQKESICVWSRKNQGLVARVQQLEREQQEHDAAMASRLA
jgi:hypothetical protein